MERKTDCKKANERMTRGMEKANEKDQEQQ